MAGERELHTEAPVGGEKPITVSVGKGGGDHKAGVPLPPGSTVAKALEAAGFTALLNGVRQNSKAYNIRVSGEDNCSLDTVLQDGNVVLVLAENIVGAIF